MIDRIFAILLCLIFFYFAYFIIKNEARKWKVRSILKKEFETIPQCTLKEYLKDNDLFAMEIELGVDLLEKEYPTYSQKKRRRLVENQMLVVTKNAYYLEIENYVERFFAVLFVIFFISVGITFLFYW